jgi:hypothetical protein
VDYNLLLLRPLLVLSGSPDTEYQVSDNAILFPLVVFVANTYIRTCSAIHLAVDSAHTLQD